MHFPAIIFTWSAGSPVSSIGGERWDIFMNLSLANLDLNLSESTNRSSKGYYRYEDPFKAPCRDPIVYAYITHRVCVRVCVGGLLRVFRQPIADRSDYAIASGVCCCQINNVIQHKISFGSRFPDLCIHFSTIRKLVPNDKWEQEQNWSDPACRMISWCLDGCAAALEVCYCLYIWDICHKMLLFICMFCQTANVSKRNFSNCCQYIFSVTSPAIFAPPQGDEVTLWGNMEWLVAHAADFSSLG